MEHQGGFPLSGRQGPETKGSRGMMHVLVLPELNSLIQLQRRLQPHVRPDVLSAYLGSPQGMTLIALELT